MIADQLFCIRQSLNKAYRLGKPGHAAIEAFKAKLITLLYQAAGQENEEEAKIYLMEILRDTYFTAGYEEVQGNSSPVCYADVPGLRAGFEDPFSRDLQTAPSQENTYLPGSPLPDRAALSPDVREALLAAISGVRQILSVKGVNLQADVALEKQIQNLVYQLYGLNPEGMLHPGGQ
jgi:hypothetical protein